MIDEAELGALQKRTLRTLVAGQIVGSAGFTSSITVAGLIVEDLLGGDRLAGLGTATATVGTAIGSAHLARTMMRRGRRPGLVRGYRFAFVGAVLAVIGTEARLLPVFLVGMALYGHGQASNLLARYAAADLARPEERGRAISTLVFASTFGAIAGPALVGAGKWLGRETGIDELAGPFLFGAVFFALASLNAALRLRPDPLVVAGGLDERPRGRRADLRDSLRAVNADQLARLAFTAMVISQVVMVSVMTMTPLHMKDHGHSIELVGAVISVHIAGMYAFAPLVGRFSDQRGRVPAIATGACILLAGCVVTALAGHAPSLLFAGLLLLGLGWSFGLVAGSALLSERVSVGQRVGVQGVTDLCMSACGGIAGFGSGFVKHALGFHMLADLGTLAAGALLVVALGRGRRTAPTASPSLPA
jgi:MFS family permease